MEAHMKISTQTKLFFSVEIRNTGGVQPATLSSALDSLLQATPDIVSDWCGYREDDLTAAEQDNIRDEVLVEVRRLIKQHGKRKELEILL
jgi:hypothetical protein